MVEKLVAVRRKQSYVTPTVCTMCREQAAIILLGRSWDGDQNAKEFLEEIADFLFPAPVNSMAAKSGA